MNLAGATFAPILGIFTTGRTAAVIRPLRPLGDAAGYATVQDAVAALATQTADASSTAGVLHRDGRYHGVQLGLTGVEQLAHGGMLATPTPWSLRGVLHHGHRTSITLSDPTLLAVVDGGFNDRNRFNSGVVLHAPHVTLDEVQASKLVPARHADNAGRLIDLAAL